MIWDDNTLKDWLSAERLERLIQDLLSYSRLSRTELRLRSVSLSSVVAEAIKQLEVEIKQRQALVIVEEPLPIIWGNHTVLLQVVSNLLANAIKFVAPGVQPQIKIWAQEQGNYVRLWVEDNGIGIAPEYQKRIFKIFERLHGNETYDGTGIGLAIVCKGMERLGGSVGVESAVGKGSCFWLEGLKKSEVQEF